MRRMFHDSLIILMVLAVGISAFAPTALAKKAQVITKEELKPIMNDSDVVILDVRRGRDWDSSEFKIQGAVRVDAGKVKKWAGNYSKDKKLILYCA